MDADPGPVDADEPTTGQSRQYPTERLRGCRQVGSDLTLAHGQRQPNVPALELPGQVGQVVGHALFHLDTGPQGQPVLCLSEAAAEHAQHLDGDTRMLGSETGEVR